MKSEAELRQELCEIGKRLYATGLVGATEGNISVRFGDNALLCSPSGVCKGFLHEDDIVLIDLQGHPLRRGEPSSEIKLHLRAYDLRKDCQAVVHAHPLTATGFALANEPFPDELLPEAIAVLGKVALIPFAMPGTDAVPDSMNPFLPSHNTFLLGNHGAATLGSSLLDAYYRMETLERVARIVVAAKIIGKPKPLPEESVAILKAKFPTGLQE